MAQVVPIALSAINIARGIGNEAKLKKEAANLERNKPIKQTSQFDRDALALTESELANGMSAGAERAYDDSVDRGLSSSISAILKGGGSVNNIGDVYDTTEQGRQNLAVIQDQLRLTHINNVLKQYDKMSSEEEKNWIVNNYAPYKDKLQAIGEQRKAAASMINSGIDTAGSGLMSLMGAKQENTFLSNFLKSGTGSSGGSDGGASGVGRITVNENTIQPQFTHPAGLESVITKQPPASDYLLPASNNNDWSNFWESYKMKI